MTIHLLQQLLDSSAARWPERPAVAFQGTDLTYAALADQSDRLAGHLISTGVGNGDRVGVLTDKRCSAITCLLAILKAGAVYVPLDPTSPAGRLAFIARNCGVRHLLVAPLAAREERLAADIENVTVIDGPADSRPGWVETGATAGWEEALSAAPRRADDRSLDLDLAYILYTSGSTGEPKGVMISHRNALTFINWCLGEFGLRPEDRLSNHAPFHFDLSVLDVYCALAAGACVLPVPEDLSYFPARLSEWVERERISIWYSVPSVLMLLAARGALERRDLNSLRLVLFAGEVFPIKHLQSLVEKLGRRRYYNLYGPTETNVCTFHEVDLDELERRQAPLPIGRPCGNMDVFAIDEEGRPVTGPGTTGELLVRGAGVALGYWGRPERTAASFGQSPLRPEPRDIVYRTGDLVEAGPGGEWLYLGRSDQQIKSRGYRVELGEIENALYEHPSVREAVVYAVPDEMVGSRIMAAVTVQGEPDEAALSAHCSRRLPHYMIPEAFEFHDHMPRTPNGKVDRRRLIESVFTR